MTNEALLVASTKLMIVVAVSFMYPADLQEYQLFGLGEDHLSMIVE